MSGQSMQLSTSITSRQKIDHTPKKQFDLKLLCYFWLISVGLTATPSKQH